MTSCTASRATVDRSRVPVTPGHRHDDPPDECGGSGLRRRLLLDHVPEKETGKNRVHLALHVGAERRAAEVARLEGLGARTRREADEPGGQWVVLTDSNASHYAFWGSASSDLLRFTAGQSAASPRDVLDVIGGSDE